MKYPHDVAERWLRSNRDNFSNPFYLLLNFLLTLHKELACKNTISWDDYKQYFKERFFSNNFPFHVPFPSVPGHKDIKQFINAFDHAYLGRMVHGVFIALIKVLSDERKSMHLLDFGTGKTCGMYGKNGRFLFETGDVNIGAISFFGIDDLHKPRGSIFEHSTYKKSNILSFHPEVKFDLITGHHVLEHCYNWEEVLAHVSHLLKQDGYLYMSFPRFGGFYDTVYRLMSPLDHRAHFDIALLKSFSERVGLELCFSDNYVDPNSRFEWICALYPDLVDKKTADCFYDLCVDIDSKVFLSLHHYGYYVVFRKTA